MFFQDVSTKHGSNDLIIDAKNVVISGWRGV